MINLNRRQLVHVSGRLLGRYMIPACKLHTPFRLIFNISIVEDDFRVV
jgi:hypothetical protein